MVLLLPFIEQQSITAMIEAGGTACHSGGTYNYPAMTYPYPFDIEYVPWLTVFAVRLCPSDSQMNREKTIYMPGPSNYRGCFGDSVNRWNTDKNSLNAKRGVFKTYTKEVGCDPAKFNDGLNQGRDISEITDGLSNTLAFSEARIAAGKGDALSTTAPFKNPNPQSPALCLTAIDPNNRTKFKTQYATEDYNGRRWCEGREWIYAACHTILPPNSPTCLFHWETTFSYERETMCTVSSYHSGGVNAAKADGAVFFVTNNINAGNQNGSPWASTGTSQYGIWGAFGSINGGETETP
jgi:hypothetical protein